MPNMTMVATTLARITDENLDMSSWGKTNTNRTPCGTTMCFAGHAVVAAGYELRWDPATVESELFNGEWIDVVTEYKADYTTDGREVSSVAREVLDIDYDQAGAIFYAEHIDTVDQLADRVYSVLDGTYLDYDEEDACDCC